MSAKKSSFNDWYEKWGAGGSKSEEVGRKTAGSDMQSFDDWSKKWGAGGTMATVSPNVALQKSREKTTAQKSYAQQKYGEAVKRVENGSKTNFWDRVKSTVRGGFGGSVASNVDATRTLYATGQGGRTARDKEQAEWYQHQLDRAQTEYKQYAEDYGEDNHYTTTAKAEVERLQKLVDALGQSTETQKKATKKTEELGDQIQQKSNDDIEKAKDGLGTVGQMLVDAGASTTQMIGDMAANAALGTSGSMLPFAFRAFGGGTQKARQAGGDLKQQAIYGGAMAAKEVFTEKMFNMALPFKKAYGDGTMDGAFEKVIRTATDKLTDKLHLGGLGEKAIGTVLTAIGGGAGEGLEEFLGDWMEWQMPRIYGGDVDSAADTLANSLYDFAVGGMSGLLGDVTLTPAMRAANRVMGYQNEPYYETRAQQKARDDAQGEVAQVETQEKNPEIKTKAEAVAQTVEQNERMLRQNAAAEMQQENTEAVRNAAQVQDAVPFSQRVRENSTAVGEEQKVPAEVMAQGPAAVRTYQRLSEANARMDAAEQKENMPQKSVEGAQTRFNEDGGAMAAEVQRAPQTAREAYMQAAARYDGVPYVSEEEIAQQNAEKYGEDAQTYLNAKQTSTLSAEDFDDAWSIAYAQGAANPAGNVREGYMQMRDAMRAEYTEDQISDAAMEFAYELGREGAKNNERTESSVREGSKRNDGARADGQAGGVEERAGKAKDEEAKHLKGRPFRKGELAEGVKSQATVQLVTEGETKSMKRARAIGEKRGMEVYFFRGGDLQFGDIYANGCICDGEVWIRADDPEYTADQIMRHEAKHDAIEKGEVDPYEEWQKLEQRFGVERMDSYVEAYAEAVAGMDLSEAEIEEEILCDAAGGMNKFEGKLDILAAEFGEVLDAAAQETTQENSERGPPEGEKNTAKTGGVKYSMKGGDVLNLDIAWDNDNDSSLKSQMIKHAAEINGMEPVTEVTYDKKGGKPYFEQLDEVLRSRFNYRISRPDGMSFLFDKNAIATLRHYIGSDEEAAAAIASPYVLKRGKMISGHKNHKGNRYPSVTFAAPAKLNGNTGNIAVSVLFGDKGRVHSLRVLTPDGKQFILQKTKADSEMGYVPDKAELAAPTESASKDSIPASSEKSNKKIKTSAVGRKAEQLAVILENNPVEDDYHTWIRSESDILTLQEAIDDPESADYEEYDPDWTRKMAKEAIESGTVTVYSSKPITKGGFVSPSKMEAESYSGTGKVYSKRVAVDDVAWIDPTQGQYAPVKKVKASAVAKDSKGRKLSEQQAEYFQDSKVRDKDGNLLVMYRGGNEDFTVFDRKKSKPSNLYGRGFYFTNSETHAKQYGNAKPYYLNIKNPLIPGNHAITKKQLRAFLEAVAEDEDYGLENYGYGETVDSVLESVWSEDDFAMLQDVNATAVGDFVAAVELFNEVNGTDYDGLITPTETVTFRSSQAKNIDNTSPTEDPDIRFSATGTAAVAALEEQNNALKEQVKQLNREKAKLQKQVESKTAQVNKWKNKATFSPERVGRDIIRAYQSTVAETEIHDDIKELLQYAGQKDGIT